MFEIPAAARNWEVLLSATAISLWGECQRKWGFKYLEQIKIPPGPAALLGTEVHDEQLDPYLMRGRGFDFTRPSGEIANALTPLLPRPMAPGMRTKRAFVLPSPSGKFAYLGELDLYATDSACVPGLVGGVPLNGDFKTTGNLTWAKDATALKTDIQHTIYATTLMFEDGVDELDSVWFYARTRGKPRVQRTHLQVRRHPSDRPDVVSTAQVVERFLEIDASGVTIAAIKLAKPKVDDLPPNARMCDQYGGCPFRSICNLSPSVHATAVNMEAVAQMETKTNDFLANLRKQTGAPVPAPGFVAVPQPPSLAPPQAATHTAPVDPTAIPSWAQSTKPYAGAAAAATAPAVNPPEAALPPAPPVGAAAPPSVEAPKRRGRPPASAAPVAAPVAPKLDVSAQHHPTVSDGARIEYMETLAPIMRELGVRRIVLDATGQLLEIEIVFAGSP